MSFFPTSNEDGNRVSPALQVIQMIEGYWLSQVVYVAAKLGIADHLADGPKSVDAIAIATQSNTDALYRLLRACACFGLLNQESDHRTFSLTPMGELLKTDKKGSLRDYAIGVIGPGHWLTFGKLEQAILSGASQCKNVLGMELWEYYAQHEQESLHFSRTMGYLSQAAALDVVAHYDASQARNIVDVGGSHGMLLSKLLEVVPTAKGVLFDLPNVIDQARIAVKSSGMEDRITLISGDFFQGVPVGGDLYLLKQILHDWNDAECLTLLKNIHQVANPESKLLVVEMLVPDQPEPSLVPLTDLAMLVLLGGRERTGQDYGLLLAKAGFRVERIISTHGLFSVIEAVRV
ncbi:MAG: hypothetical protein RLY14_360 [Planctomycetota bacterium]|jgi:hypothetical protein